MAVRLYVGNLPYSVSQEALSELFAEAGGVVDVHLPTERDSGRLRGFGFVEMASDAEAQEAIQRFNGYRLGDRELRVNIAEERPDARGRGGRS